MPAGLLLSEISQLSVRPSEISRSLWTLWPKCWCAAQRQHAAYLVRRIAQTCPQATVQAWHCSQRGCPGPGRSPHWRLEAAGRARLRQGCLQSHRLRSQPLRPCVTSSLSRVSTVWPLRTCRAELISSLSQSVLRQSAHLLLLLCSVQGSRGGWPAARAPGAQRHGAADRRRARPAHARLHPGDALQPAQRGPD